MLYILKFDPLFKKMLKDNFCLLNLILFNFIMDDSYSLIKRIQFSIIKDDLVKDLSVFGKNEHGIMISELYDNGEPKDGGLLDLKLGTSSNSSLCETCNLTIETCPGHFGHTKLESKMFFIGTSAIVQKILTCICPRCSMILIDKDNTQLINEILSKDPKDRIPVLKRGTKNLSVCRIKESGCGNQIPKIRLKVKKQTGSIIFTEIYSSKSPNSKNIQKVLSAEEVYEILKKIPKRSYNILGFNNKYTALEDFIITNMIIPPVCLRPSSKGGGLDGFVSEDDLSNKLVDIIRANNRIRKNREKKSSTDADKIFDDEYAQCLQTHITTMFYKDPTVADKRSKPTKPLYERLRGKNGRVRGNLNGKRVDFTARSVITPDPTLDVSQVGMPILIAKSLSIRETVNLRNINYLKRAVKNGKDIYPGANSVIKRSKNHPNFYSQEIDLRYGKDNISLECGDIVNRHLINDDVVLINRQPTLHKQSMMAHSIKIIDDDMLKTFRLPISATTPYNADFDGDEINCHVPQSYVSKSEIKYLSSVEKLFITPTTSKSVIGLVQDGLIGAYLLSDDETNVTWREYLNYTIPSKLLTNTIEKRSYKGKEVISALIPSKINYKRANIVVERGEILGGNLSKLSVGAKRKASLIQSLLELEGHQKTNMFLNNIQRLSNRYLLKRGFSVGPKDLLNLKHLEDMFTRLIKTKELELEYKITKMESNPRLMSSEVFEQGTFNLLNSARTELSEIVQMKIDKNNSFKIMSDSGSKGDTTNMTQMTACLGLQAMEGKLVTKQYNFRTLPYFHQHDDRSESRGFIKTPFINNFSYPSFVFHLSAAREGLTTQVVQSVSSDTKILVKNNEDEISIYEIGILIDKSMSLNNLSVDSTDNMEILNVKEMNMSIDSVNSEGKSKKLKISHFCRHYSGELYYIKTKYGKEIKVVNSKTMLIYNNKKLIPTKTSEISIGDKVPINYRTTLPSSFLNEYSKQFSNVKNCCIKLLRDTIDCKCNYNSLVCSIASYYLTKIGVFSYNIEGSMFFSSYTLIWEHCKDVFPDKELYFKELKTNLITGPIEYFNDMVLDEIIYISPIRGLRNNRIRVYDLTVEETKNFSVLNGLNIADTAKCGYIQKKLVKSSEDVKSCYDGTCRDSEDRVVQIIYGSSGADSTKQNEYTIKFINKNNEEIKKMFTDESFTKELNEDILKNVISLRDQIRYTQIKSKFAWDNDSFTFLLPLNLELLVNNIMEETTSEKKVSPEYVNKRINELTRGNVTIIGNYSMSKLREVNEKINKSIFLASLYDCISPKNCINVSKKSFDKCINTIVSAYREGMVQAGEMVGVVAGQSMGEPLTQMSVSEDTYVMVKNNISNKIEFDDKIKNLKHFLLERKHSNIKRITVRKMLDNKIPSELIELRDNLFSVVSVSKNSFVDWSVVSHLTIHPANGYLLEVITEGGHKVETTLTHSHLKLVGGIIMPVLASELKLEDKIPRLSSCHLKGDVFKNGNILWDKIKTINKLSVPKSTIVYDLTVPGTETFMTNSGIFVHNTLDTFHFSGIAAKSSTVQGVPRMEEILGASKKPKTPRVIIHLDKKHRTNEDYANKISTFIEFISVGDIKKSIEIIYDPEMEKHSKEHISVGDIDATLPFLIRVYLDKEKVVKNNLSMLDILYSFILWNNINSNIKIAKKEEKKYLQKISKLEVFSSLDSANIIFIDIRVGMKTKEMYIFEFFNGFVENMVIPFKIKGFEEVKNILSVNKEKYIEYKKDGSLIEQEGFSIYARCSKIEKLFYINGIDTNKLITNNVIDAFSIFGIESGRAVLVKEITEAYEKAGGQVNPQHIELFADQMTMDGFINSMDRHGIMKSNRDPLSRASFEKVVETMFSAAQFSESENFKGVSSSIMCGMPIRGGTGIFNIELDTDAYERVKEYEYTEKDTKRINLKSKIKDILE